MMNTKQTVLLMLTVGAAMCYFIYQFQLMDPFVNIQSSAYNHNSRQLAAENGASVFQKRHRHMMQQCQADPEKFYTGAVKSATNYFLVDKKHSVVFCYVPKNACSFWKRVFSITNGQNEGAVVFNLSSVAIHKRVGAFTGKLYGNSFIQAYHFLQTARKIMFVRDPYERLFSGYIDKLFSPCASHRSHLTSISRFRPPHGRGLCEGDLTFAGFLSYVTNNISIAVNEHFGKQYEMCLPCHVKYDYIGKLDTFHQDADFILREVIRMDPSLVFGPEDTFEENSDVNIMNDVIDRTFTDCGKVQMLRCPSRYDILHRLWITFQVRGYLSVKQQFPLSKLKAPKTNAQQFKRLVLAAYRQSGDRSTVKRQRHTALLEAFHSVPRSLLARVERYVRNDCDLFGYECAIDVRFKLSTKTKPVFHLADAVLRK